MTPRGEYGPEYDWQNRKTEAVVAPVCERLISERWDGLNVLVINDLPDPFSAPLRILLAEDNPSIRSWLFES